MLLPKTGWRLKHFISQKKNNDIEKPAIHVEHDHLSDHNGLSGDNPERLSWLSQASSTETSRNLRRASSNITTRSLHFTSPSTTAHSSASSLCSCDCEASLDPIEHSLFNVDPLPPHPEILYLPPVPSEFTAGDEKTWSLIVREPPLRPLTPRELEFGPSASSMTKFGPGSSFDGAGVLSADLLDDDKTPTQSLRYTESDMEDGAENVEQLIRETDKAFRAVGTALADAKAATEGWHETRRTASSQSPSISRGASKRNVRPVLSPLKTPVSRAKSVSKGKRNRFGKRGTIFFGKKTPKVPHPPTNTPARWTLTDATTNMADLFSGKMFRTQVDEMLTPGRIQQLKLKHESERKMSMGSVRSSEGECNTPTEPFHLESLSSHITAAQQNSSPLASDIPPPIPPRAPRRSSAPIRGPFLLPTIPEIAALNLTGAQDSFSSSSSAGSSRPSPTVLTTATHIFLPSTHYTLTAPGFRHGPIRLERLARSRKEASPDGAGDALDWIAFQMAISGTMEDERGSAHDMRGDAEWEADEAEIDAIVDWYRGFGFGFGFGGHGRIASEAEAKEREREREAAASRPRRWTGERRSPGGASLSRHTRSRRSWSDSLPDLGPSPPPRHPSHKHDHDHQRPGEPRRDREETAAVAPPQHSAARPVSTAAARRPSLAESVLSLPPSPMLDLVVPALVRDDEVPIPMGFNLGHDLGDFLSWEATHVQTLYVDSDSLDERAC